MTRTLNSVDETELMARHLAGDNDAFMELFNRLNHRMYMYALKMTGNQEAAEDISQEAWERIILLRRSPVDVEHPVSYIYKVIRNQCLTSIRARRRQPSVSPLDEATHPESESERRSDIEEIVLEALDQLPMDYREVLILNVYSGYNLAEIAAMKNKTIEAIYKRASRAREKLRDAVMAHPDYRPCRETQKPPIRKEVS